MHLMELLDDVCHMESRFGPFGDIVSFHSLRNHFGCTCWHSLVKGLQWMLGSVYLEILLILMQNRCTVCMERTKCLEINLDAHDGTLR